MKKNFLKIFCVMSVLLLSSTFFVACDGDKGGNNLSFETVYNSISKQLNQLKNGEMKELYVVFEEKENNLRNGTSATKKQTYDYNGAILREIDENGKESFKEFKDDYLIEYSSNIKSYDDDKERHLIWLHDDVCENLATELTFMMLMKKVDNNWVWKNFEDLKNVEEELKAIFAGEGVVFSDFSFSMSKQTENYIVKFEGRFQDSDSNISFKTLFTFSGSRLISIENFQEEANVGSFTTKTVFNTKPSKALEIPQKDWKLGRANYNGNSYVFNDAGQLLVKDISSDDVLQVEKTVFGFSVVDAAVDCNVQGNFKSVIWDLPSVPKKFSYFTDNIENVTLTNNVKIIGEGAFKYCNKISTINIPESVESIGLSAFYACTELKSITIPSSVKKIDEFAFNLCRKLSTVIISDSVEMIGGYAFDSCGENLKVFCEAKTQPSGWDGRWNNGVAYTYWFSSEQPTESGRFWHYVDGKPTIWE